MTRPFRSHYDNLQVHEQASREVIEAAWRTLRQKWRADLFQGDQAQSDRALRVIDHAYYVLSDPVRRRQHDDWIQAQRAFIEVPGPDLTPVPVSPPLPAGPPPFPRHRSGPFGLTVIVVGWVLTFALLWWLFDDYLERREFPNRDLVVAEGSASEWVLRRNHAGHYLAPGRINGHDVVFLVDTGATQVSVPAHLADTLGLKPGARGRALTANGSVEIRHTRIADLALGPFTMRGVSGHINPGMQSDQVLLGMSVLRHLEFTQRGEHLILRVP